MQAGIRPRRADGEGRHDFVIAQVDAELINRRKRLPPTLRGTLQRIQNLRLKADYENDDVSETEVRRALRRCQDFVHAVQARGGRTP